MSTATIRIAQPDEAMLTPVNIRCAEIRFGDYVVTTSIYGDVLESDFEELVARASKGDLEHEWWDLGTRRGVISHRVEELYAKYATGWYTQLTWYKRPVF